ncbi:elongation of very long chain fatty acids protein 4-like [Gigantopelta aegis]|uniref:elongation of very long chain fatty acids protein 4-like n=1 Tax=Gigantopelta aegis TaxID=1735272 RepID=UPI001B88955B|nr:elongation of very long chain fatty acids protein 4-like [Gigantopelta aegis]XP_041360044.1 elongation of very long chain fatty acids protein 4-like [Gigantopelta aegis]XP_041360045.1 elongation of very long chain fatty acids protein 4-like [Gigantopelta aegis]XP_041360046.1 elongation of very long chain fatty acids protein 4-like [Gigantopelta aegis]XP_041360047.1 elongation of very long chain fatty acids protein 4-like [Gigantopelta aegis]XP_041360048.1 elongation of very long chain fatty
MGIVARSVDYLSKALGLPETDRRVKEWPFMNSPGAVLSITFVYLLVVKHGPKWMEKRRPFEFPRLLLLYNLNMVALSFYMCYEFVYVSIVDKYQFGCQAVDTSDRPTALRMASVAWWYFFSKIIELLDTVIFILRKKYKQVTFLHVFHHSTMVCCCWITAKYMPGGEKFVPGSINCFIHVFMYLYYGLAALGPSIQKYLWWKKYLTKLQIIQFVIVVVHAAYSLTLEPCDFPYSINVFMIVYAGFLLMLFARFYRQSYIKHSKLSEFSKGD